MLVKGAPARNLINLYVNTSSILLKANIVRAITEYTSGHIIDWDDRRKVGGDGVQIVCLKINGNNCVGISYIRKSLTPPIFMNRVSTRISL